MAEKLTLTPAPTSAPPVPLPGIRDCDHFRELIKTAADKLETLECAFEGEEDHNDIGRRGRSGGRGG